MTIVRNRENALITITLLIVGILFFME
jgi:hypothetical protein